MPPIESLMAEQGGVGRIQILVFLITWFQLASGNWMNYQFNFLLKYPVMECFRGGELIPEDSPEYTEFCKPAYVCENTDVTYNILYDNELSLNNWIRDYDLLCESHIAISFFSMAWIIGFLIGFFVIPYFQDTYGRKYVYTINIFLIDIIMIIIVQLPHKNSTKWTLYFLIIVTGFFSAARFMTGYNYMTELWPAKYLSTVSSINNVLEGTIIINLSIFYMKVSKDWQPIFYYGAASGLAAMTINCVVLPESPKWLYSQKKYAACSKALSQLARLNGVK